VVKIQMEVPHRLKSAVVVCLFLLTPSVRAEGIRCWVRCHCPHKIKSAADVPSVLRSSQNPRLSFLPRSTGILTTYLGKMVGIQGWRDYHLRATAKGTVIHATWSTDFFYTIDLRIEQLSVQRQAVRLPTHPTFIRIEVFPLVRIGAPLPVREGEEIIVSGKLMWDADGFLEIHPKKRKDFETPKPGKQIPSSS
jgi:hypothetical protein